MKIFVLKFLLYILVIFIVAELCINYMASCYLFPIKYAESYGFIEKKTGEILVPLNKYYSRTASYIALPFEFLKLKYYDKKLIKAYNAKTKKFGFKDEKGEVIINYKFDEVQEFDKNYAIVAVLKDKNKKYGTIDKSGNWVIKPEYSYICNSKKYYLKACLDKNHCGVMDKFGNRITQMTYNIENIKCENCDKIAEFCSIGSKNKNMNCNYFLW